jgi:hypothetical protein
MEPMENRAMKHWFTMKYSITLCIAVIATSCCLVGCGEDDPDGANNIHVKPSDADNNDPDDGGQDADAILSDVGIDTDTTPPITDLCNGTIDLGTIEASGEVSDSNDTASGTSLLDPSCGASANNEVIYQFRVNGTARVNVEVQSQVTDDWVLSLASGTCDSPTPVKCKASRADVFVADPETTYFLTVEPQQSGLDAPFSLSLATTALACAPLGASTCDSDDVVRCESGFQEVTYSCAYACENTACGSDLCSNAIEVATAGAHSFSGPMAGYGNQFNFQNRDDCTSASVGVNTPGQDLVFSLPGLSEGDPLTVDTSSDDLRQAIFVLNGACSQDAACATGGLQVDNVLEWTVEADGDYYVVVDLLEDETADFDVTISR